MIQFFKSLLRGGPRINVEELLSKGAVTVDVRNEKEFRSGHVTGSVNIPLDKLQKNIPGLNKNKPVITCCASGSRSAAAKTILRNNGFTEVYNGGSWANVQRHVN